MTENYGVFSHVHFLEKLINLQDCTHRKVFNGMKNNVKTQNQLIILVLTVCILFVTIMPTNSNSEANLVKEFSIPVTIGSVIVKMLDASATTVSVISILAVLATGGAGIVAAAGRTALTTYLKNQLKKRGQKAFIAW